MKKQLLSWAQNPTYDNMWNRLALTGKGTLVAASVWHDESDKFHANILNLNGEGVALISEGGFSNIQEAQVFADKELKRQGYTF